jgi:hypothetical protein
MGIVMDPSKSFVNITIYYVEETMDHGHSLFHFIEDQDEFDQWKKKGYDIKTNEAPSGPQSVEDPKHEINTIYVLNTVWRRLTWKEHNAIYAQSIRTIRGEEGMTYYQLDQVQYRDLKLKTCLKKWDAKDDLGNDVPLTVETIDNLEREVALALLNNFEKATEPSEQELKN